MISIISLALVAAPLAAAPAAASDKPTPAARCAAAIAYSNAHRGVAVLVLKDGKAVCEGYHGGDAATSHELWSGTKSMVGLMAAAAVQGRLLTLDEPLSATLTEWRGDAARQGITFRQLLSMTSGHSGTIGRPPSYADAVAAPLTARPGARFQYSPTAMQIFGEVMRRKLIASGRPGNPVAWFRQQVLDPANIVVAKWRDGPDGNPLMPQGAVMTAREWAKLGELVRAGGKLGNRALVDPAAFAALFKGSAANPAYGLTWWLPHPTTARDPVTASSDIPSAAARLPGDLVYAAGAGDQRLYVIPSQQLVIVRQAQLDLRALALGERSGWSDAAFLDIVLGQMTRP